MESITLKYLNIKSSKMKGDDFMTEKRKFTSISKKRKIILIVAVVMLFLYTIIWYIGMFRQYAHWQYEFYTKYDTWYVYEDEDYYNYSFAYPYFLLFKGGNLAIGPSIVHHPNTVVDSEGNIEYMPQSSIIIWMKPFYQGVKEVGVILVEGEMQRQVYLTDSKTARYPDDQIYVDNHQTEINVLFEKAEKMWGLEMPWGK